MRRYYVRHIGLHDRRIALTRRPCARRLIRYDHDHDHGPLFTNPGTGMGNGLLPGNGTGLQNIQVDTYRSVLSGLSG
jgi:hypothetical protein